MNQDETAKIAVNDRVVESELDGEFSLYDPRSEEVHILNETASDIWGLVDGQHTLGDMVDLLAKAYRIDPETIRADVEHTVGGWMEIGLVRPAE